MKQGKSHSTNLIDGLVTAVAVILTFLAFDDITTDNATSFRVEYACAVACGAWVLLLVARLVRRGYRSLAALTGALLLVALWGQRGIGPGFRPGWQPAYVAATGAAIGIMLVACYLLFTGFRSMRADSKGVRGRCMAR